MLVIWTWQYNAVDLCKCFSLNVSCCLPALLQNNPAGDTEYMLREKGCAVNTLSSTGVQPFSPGATDPLFGCRQPLAAAAGTGCRGWAVRRQRTAGFLSKPASVRPWCPPSRWWALRHPGLRLEPPYLRAFEQLYIKPNNKERRMHLLISAPTEGCVLNHTYIHAQTRFNAHKNMSRHTLRTHQHRVKPRDTTANTSQDGTHKV